MASHYYDDTLSAIPQQVPFHAGSRIGYILSARFRGGAKSVYAASWAPAGAWLCERAEPFSALIARCDGDTAESRRYGQPGSFSITA
jgi:hypothetical protein